MDSHAFCWLGPFRVPIELGATILASVECLLNVLFAFVVGEDLLEIVLCLLEVLLCVSVLYALKVKKAVYFLPFIILETINLALYLFLALALMLLPKFIGGTKAVAVINSMASLHFVEMMFKFWTFSLIVRAYWQVKEVQVLANANRGAGGGEGGGGGLPNQIELC